MKKLIGVTSIALLLSGCGQSTEQICKKTDQILWQSTGEGFVDTGWAGCLKLTPAEAQQSLDALQKTNAEGAKKPELMSRGEMDQFIKTQDPFYAVNKLGKPVSATFVPLDSAGHTIPLVEGAAQSIVMIDYSAFDKKPSPQNLKDIRGNLASYTTGRYIFLYYNPLTHDLFGSTDSQLVLQMTMKNGKLESYHLGYPDYFWQRWLR